MTTDRWNQAAFFWIGLLGIVATGAMVGIGGDNYWALILVRLTHRSQRVDPQPYWVPLRSTSA